MCIYIYISEVQARTNIQPNGSILYKRRFNTTCYYKEFMYTICLKRKVHTKLQRNTSSRPAHKKATRTTQPEEWKRESDE